MSRQQFARDSFGIFAAQIAVMALGIGTSVITARTLGPSGRGLLQLLTIFPATMSNFAKLGIQNLKNGIVTRGILIDIPRLRGVLAWR